MFSNGFCKGALLEALSTRRVADENRSGSSNMALKAWKKRISLLMYKATEKAGWKSYLTWWVNRSNYTSSNETKSSV